MGRDLDPEREQLTDENLGREVDLDLWPDLPLERTTTKTEAQSNREPEGGRGGTPTRTLQSRMWNAYDFHDRSIVA